MTGTFTAVKVTSCASMWACLVSICACRMITLKVLNSIVLLGTSCTFVKEANMEEKLFDPPPSAVSSRVNSRAHRTKLVHTAPQKGICLPHSAALVLCSFVNYQILDFFFFFLYTFFFNNCRFCTRFCGKSYPRQTVPSYSCLKSLIFVDKVISGGHISGLNWLALNRVVINVVFSMMWQTHLQYLKLRISLEESKVRNILLNWI